MTALTIAQGSRSQLLFLPQGSIGTPPSANFVTMRLTSHSLSAVKSSVESQEIRADREVADVRHGNISAQGDINFELNYSSHHEWLIESAMFNEFVDATDTSSIYIGTTPRYIAMEDGALDIGKYRYFLDMVCTRMGFSFRTGSDAIVRVSSSWVGTQGGTPQNTSRGGSSPFAASTLSPFDTFQGTINEQVGIGVTGAEIGNVASIDINIDNGVAPVFALGQQEAVALEFGRGRVSGTVTAYYSDHRWLDDFLDETEKTVHIACFDPAGNSMRWLMQRVKFMGGDVPLDREQSRMVTLPFIALRDHDNLPFTALQIYKDPA